jgi:hypothetical protein
VTRVNRKQALTVVAVAGCLLVGASAQAEPPPGPNAPQAPTVFNEHRILGVIPDYQTVRDPTLQFVPLTPKQKWILAAKETIDPFNIANAAFSAGLSQADNETPKYGRGGAAYGKRFGAALGDFGTQNFFSAGVLACWWHQDPRYFRRGPESRLLVRVGYSISRAVVVRRDSGTETFNSSGIFGMALGIAASNLYYPAASRKGTVMAERLGTSVTGTVIGNLMSEFWPDIQKKFSHKKQAGKG